MRQLSKSTRVLLVWETVKSLGRASPAAVLDKVATQLGADRDDPNLRRTIYRDLKQLADEGRLHARAFSADGRELDADESSTHLRIEYSVLGEDTEDRIPGWKSLESGGFSFVSPGRRSLQWSVVASPEPRALAGKISFIFLGRRGQVLALQLPLDELPCGLVLARGLESSEESTWGRDEFQAAFGARTALLYAPEPTVSRSVPGQRFGHLVIQLKPGPVALIRDLGSSTGTHFAEVRREEVDLGLEAFRQKLTRDVSGGLFDAERNWTTGGRDEKLIPMTCLVRAGRLRFVFVVS